MFRNFRLSAYLFDLLQIFFFLDQTDRIISLIIQYGAQGKTGRYIQCNARCGDLIFPIPQITSKVTTLDTRFLIFIVLHYVHIRKGKKVQMK